MKDHTRKIQTPMLFRAARANTIDEESRTVEASFSSETPVERFFGLEILGHERGEVDTSRVGTGHANVLVDHDTRDVVGVVEEFRLEGGRSVGRLRFGRSVRANEVFRDIADGIRSNISIGYYVNELTLMRAADEGPDEFRVTRWTPAEVSIVAVPADTSVGVGRSATDSPTIETMVVERRGGDIMRVLRLSDGQVVMIDESDYDATRHAKLDPAQLDAIETRATPAPKPAPAASVAPAGLTAEERDRELREVREAEQKRQREIMALATRWNAREHGEKWIADGKSLESFRGYLLDEVVPRGEELEKPEASLGLGERDLQQYSLLRLVRSQIDPGFEAPFERECAREVAQKLGRSPRGAFVPWDVLVDANYLGRWAGNDDRLARAMVNQLMGRAVEKGGGASGAALVATDLLVGNFIDILRSRTVLLQAGMTVLPGLVGDVDIPRQSAASTTGWVAEGAGSGSSTPTFDTVSLTPKTLRARVDMTRRMLLQGTPGIEALVRTDLIRVFAISMDTAGMLGAGGDAPTGIVNTGSVGTQPFSAVATWYDDLVDMETTAATADADIMGATYITTPKARGFAKKTRKIAGASDTTFIWEAGGRLNDYPVFITTILPDNGGVGTNETTTIFGQFASLLMGMWGTLDLMTDDITLGDSGGLVIRAFQDADIAVRHPEEFVIQEDAILT